MANDDRIQQIRNRLDELSASARERLNQCDPMFACCIGGAEIDVMTPKELAERHSLLMQLPSAAEERAAAQERIRQRIASRKVQFVA